MASEQILDIGAAKQLFVDERIIAEAKDLERTLNQPAKDTLRTNYTWWTRRVIRLRGHARLDLLAFCKD